MINTSVELSTFDPQTLTLSKIKICWFMELCGARRNAEIVTRNGNQFHYRSWVWEQIITIPRNTAKRDSRRLETTEKAAIIDKKIEDELIHRLINNVYPDGIQEYLKEHQRENEVENVVAFCQAPFLLDRPDVGLMFPTDVIARAKPHLTIGTGGLDAKDLPQLF